jgi:hypothetical protein
MLDSVENMVPAELQIDFDTQHELVDEHNNRPNKHRPLNKRPRCETLDEKSAKLDAKRKKQ